MRYFTSGGYYGIAAKHNYQKENKNYDRAWTGIGGYGLTCHDAYLAIISRFFIRMMVERDNNRKKQRQIGAEHPAQRLRYFAD